MASGTEVGTGYVSIKPTMDESAVTSLEAAGGKAGGGFGNAFQVAAGNLISNAVADLGNAVADTFKTAFDNYANYEQLVGGVDTLFKESSDIVQRNAAKAFETAGMSANDYMEQVTSFSASLLQSLDGDTAKAAEYADRAMVDMSDNANKMGTDIERITDAYQGFAKDNYTMLDNLKLGYGGTKTEMERLISDAAKMTDVQERLGVTVDESSLSFGNVVNAISVMQESMGIAGTTALEAQETISGSLGMLDASWNNFLTGIFDENADMGALGEQLFESIGAVFRNVAPRIGVLAERLVLGLPEAMGKALSAVPSMLEPAIMEVFGEGVGGQVMDALNGAFGELSETLSGLWAELAATFQAAWGVLQPVIEAAGSAIQAVMPVIQQAIAFVIDFIADEVLPLLQEVFAAVQPAIEAVSASVQERMPQIQETIAAVMGVVQGVIETVWPHVSEIIFGAVGAVSAVIQAAWPVISEVVGAAMEAIQAVIEAAWPVVQAVIEAASAAIQAATEAAWPAVAGIVEAAAGAIMGTIGGLEAIVSVVTGIFDAVRAAIEDPLGTAQGFIEDFAGAIEGIIRGMDLSLPQIALPHFWVDGGSFPWGIGGEGSMPDFGVDWYAQGGFVDGATLIGAGEAGPEMILPRQGALMDEFAASIAQRIGAGGGGVDIHDCTFVVREDSDIRRVALELNTLINRQKMGAMAWA